MLEVMRQVLTNQSALLVYLYVYLSFYISICQSIYQNLYLSINNLLPQTRGPVSVLFQSEVVTLL